MSRPDARQREAAAASGDLPREAGMADGQTAAVVMNGKPDTEIDGTFADPASGEESLGTRASPGWAFSLSRPVERTLPTALLSEADGKLYPIDPDFRTVLACLRRLSDPDRPDLDKLIYLAGRFFLRHPPRDPDRLFCAFVTGGMQDGAGEPPLVDFELDAGVIYASFRQQYGIDLLRAGLHWVEFRELLAGLGEGTPFGARVRLRGMDETRLPPEDRAALRRLKARVAIPTRAGKAEQALLDELDRRLAAGENPVEIIEKLQEV